MTTLRRDLRIEIARAMRLAPRLALLAFSGAAVHAQMPFGGPPPDMGAGGGPPNMPFFDDPFFQDLDADGDGAISRDELQRAPQALSELDRDGNGSLTPDEWFSRLPMDGPGGPGGGPGGPGMPPGQQLLVQEFDADRDGRLNAEERAKARAARGERFRGMDGPPFPMRGPDQQGEARRGEQVSLDDVTYYADRPLYDPGIVRTLFLEFPSEDWEEELEDFHNTDVDVPADLVVDGVKYPGVGVRFRGNTSYMFVPAGMKRPLNLSIDHTIDGQNLYGYRTLNLLNANDDPSFLREFLFYWISRNYLPSLKVNFVKLVINGENWGVYVNSQQFNKDFVKEWYDEDDGVRWKVPANLSGGSSLQYYGEELSRYKDLFELKSPDQEASWRALIGLCRALEQTPEAEADEGLGDILDLDEVLWFLAIDNLLMDDDGYFTRGSDFHMYQDSRHGRFRLFSHDNNETFRLGMGPGPGPGMGMGPPMGMPPGMDMGPGPNWGPRRGMGRGALPAPDGNMGPGPDTPGGRGEEGRAGPPGARQRGGRRAGPPAAGEAQGGWPVMAGAESDARPLLRRLLANPALKSRYLAHYRTVADESFSWEVLGPVVDHFRLLLAEEMRRDVKRRSSFEAFMGTEARLQTGQASEPDAGPGFRPGPFPGMMPGAPSLQESVESRRAYLLRQPELTASAPRIATVSLVAGGQRRPATPEPSEVGGQATIEVEIAADSAPFEAVYLHWAGEPHARFRSVALSREAGDRYSAPLPATDPGTPLFFYVEARGVAGAPSQFAPARAEFEVFRAVAQAHLADTTPVVISELMCANGRAIADAEGDFEQDQAYGRGADGAFACLPPTPGKGNVE